MAGLLVGLTGGIACGKSTVAVFLQEKGAALVDADAVSREVVAPGTPLLSALVGEFGDDILDSQGVLLRKNLAAKVFGKPQALKRLNQLTHPVIWRRCNQLVEELQLTHKVVILMAPLLLESRGGPACDLVVVVDIPRDVQLSRLCQRDSLSVEQAVARLDSQMKAAERLAEADYVIGNSGDIGALRSACEKFWQEAVLLKLNSNL